MNEDGSVEGLLLVYYNDWSTFGTICDDDIDGDGGVFA